MNTVVDERGCERKGRVGCLGKQGVGVGGGADEMAGRARVLRTHWLEAASQRRSA